MLIMPLYFRGKCNFGFRGGKLKLGLLLALPLVAVFRYGVQLQKESDEAL